MVLEDQTITSPAPPKTNDSDEAVQLLVTVEIENGNSHEQEEEKEETVDQNESKTEEVKTEELVKIDSPEPKKPEPSEIETAPPPPKRSNQTNQRLKKLSKMIKQSIPSKMPSPLIPLKKSSKAVERKSLKDKMSENELAAFLKERRAVSESRFTLVDKGRSPSPEKVIERTKSDPDINQDSEDQSKDFGPKAWGMPPGNIKNLVENFERQASPIPVSPTRSLKSPTRDLKSPDMVRQVEKSKTPSPQRNATKSLLQEADKQSTTSPESEMDNNRSETESKKGKQCLSVQ